MKKLLALTLAAALCLGLTAPALAAVPEGLPADGYGAIPENLKADLISEDWGDLRYEPAEPTLTLVVNGVESDVPIYANNWTTYADAADLRSILGAEAVAAAYDGPVPVRQVAERLGWDVVWYDGGWLGVDQQVCLWNREQVLEQIGPQVKPLEDLHAVAVALSRTMLRGEKPRQTTENLSLELTVEGDRSYQITGQAVSLIDQGVVDTTFTLDAQALAPWLDVEPETLRQTTAELIFNFNSGGMAWNVPLLGALDESLAGWQVRYFPEMAGLLEQDTVDFAGQVYDSLVSLSDLSGGVDVWEEAAPRLSVLGALLGADKPRVDGSGAFYTLTTQQANAALDQGDEAPFRRCDLSLSLRRAGQVDLVANLRTNADGAGGADVELSAASNTTLTRSSASITLRVGGFGSLLFTGGSKTEETTQRPRQVEDIERMLVTRQEQTATPVDDISDR